MSDPSKRLWDKGDVPDPVVHAFTVGDDPHWDRHLIVWDCLGSAAHARTLERAGLLASEECAALIGGLADIHRRAAEGAFEIPAELEDVHTAIEADLTRRVGAAGAKIHTGRSRNDQVITAMRLFLRRAALDWAALLDSWFDAVLARVRSDGRHPMPGYTHMQPAMPSSVGLWLHAFVEAALEQMRACVDLFDRLDRCPLGTGAGFGVPLPLDRAYTASLLGFTSVQRSPVDVQNSRGRMEIYAVRVAADIGASLEKLSWDLALYASPAYGFVSLPVGMTTGSSIMPQKRNPDVVELMRARAGRLRGRLHELEWVAGKLPSNYHRDLQLTKAPAIAAALDVEAMLPVMIRVIDGLTFNADAMRAAMGPQLHAAEAAYALVRAGVPFREAYRRVAQQIAEGGFDFTPSPESDRADHVREETLRAACAERESTFAQVQQRRARIDDAERALLGT